LEANPQRLNCPTSRDNIVSSKKQSFSFEKNRKILLDKIFNKRNILCVSNFQRRRHEMKKRIFIVLVVCLAFVLTTWADKPPKDELWKLGESIVVMTHNVYVGGYVDRILDAEDPTLIPFLVAQTFAEMESTNFNYRAEALADEIMRGKPHLVGLQEISTIYRQSPGDYLLGGTQPATDLVFDYLQILRDAIAARGLEYKVAGIIQNFDVEMPMFVGQDPEDPQCYDDVRLIDFDVILARNDVKISAKKEENYTDHINLMGIIPILRGYVAVKAKVGHKNYWVANTHLEPDDPLVKQNQAMELITFLQKKKHPVIVIGDLNAPAPEDPTYQTFLANGYVDAWTRNLVTPKTPGFTNSSNPDPELGPILRDPDRNLDQRIDLILVKSQIGICGYHFIGPVWAYVVGDELEDRIYFEYEDFYPWLWPSDHAGVIALLWIPY
jgi:hypothetical protein